MQIFYNDQSISLNNILLDTGSASSVFSADHLLDIGIKPHPDDMLCRVVGVGGSEFVFSKSLDCMRLGHLSVDNYVVEVGALDYGFGIKGIVGFDFLLKTQAVIDMRALSLKKVP